MVKMQISTIYNRYTTINKKKKAATDETCILWKMGLGCRNARSNILCKIVLCFLI